MTPIRLILKAASFHYKRMNLYFYSVVILMISWISLAIYKLSIVLLSILHEKSFRHVIVKNDSIKRGLLPSKESSEMKLLNDILSSFPSQKGIPRTANIIINTVTVAHDCSKEQQRKSHQNQQGNRLANNSQKGRLVVFFRGWWNRLFRGSRCGRVIMFGRCWGSGNRL